MTAAVELAAYKEVVCYINFNELLLNETKSFLLI